MKRAKYDYQEAEVTGWYRRAPVPYIELRSIKVEGGEERKCYTYIAKYVWAGLLAFIGFILMLTIDIIPISFTFRWY
jgi:hypothetical protein